ncbi:uncharacterized protein BDV17DRAFT_293948 [Aspergillus undulatus]|uniref:uncharacterized protein n=1 Tax=Aspergillus undulatus TaxID=1810928 RepID=UPI003CCCD1A9
MPAKGYIQTPFSRDPTESLHQIEKRYKHKHKHNKRIQSEKAKHTSSLNSPFLEHFFALPIEIRLEVYRRLLVRPCKFNPAHLNSCDGQSFINSTLLEDFAVWPHILAQPEVAGRWALPKKSPFFCDKCYADKQIEFGMKRVPDHKHVKCLCARHMDLVILLVSRRTYEEASPIS